MLSLDILNLLLQLLISLIFIFYLILMKSFEVFDFFRVFFFFILILFQKFLVFFIAFLDKGFFSFEVTFHSNLEVFVDSLHLLLIHVVQFLCFNLFGLFETNHFEAQFFFSSFFFIIFEIIARKRSFDVYSILSFSSFLLFNWLVFFFSPLAKSLFGRTSLTLYIKMSPSSSPLNKYLLSCDRAREVIYLLWV